VIHVRCHRGDVDNVSRAANTEMCYERLREGNDTKHILLELPSDVVYPERSPSISLYQYSSVRYSPEFFHRCNSSICSSIVDEDINPAICSNCVLCCELYIFIGVIQIQYDRLSRQASQSGRKFIERPDRPNNLIDAFIDHDHI